jgi:hypothetical protein
MKRKLGPALITISSVIVISACGSSRNEEPHTVKAFEQWRGQPVSVLETHNYFSTIPKRVEALSDGNELWTYSACEQWIEDQQCVGFGNSFMVLNCDGGRIGQHCCHNQFYISKATMTVGWFRAIGDCGPVR